MYDQVQKLGKSLIHHGPNNDRAYLMKLDDSDRLTIIDQLYQLCLLKRYSKIIAKVPEPYVGKFMESNFKVEAAIPGFYNGKTTGYFLGRYFSLARSRFSTTDRAKVRQIREAARAPFDPLSVHLLSGYQIRPLGPGHVVALAELYKKVFSVYPFPVFDPAYLMSTIEEGSVHYFGVFKNKQLVAASSAEVDRQAGNAEMTDFATHPDHTGMKLSVLLLRQMESVMREKGIQTLYTIARAKSPGMNKTFHRLGYTYGGILIQNTRIGSSIEHMNVWYKPV